MLRRTDDARLDGKFRLRSDVAIAVWKVVGGPVVVVLVVVVVVVVVVAVAVVVVVAVAMWKVVGPHNETLRATVSLEQCLPVSEEILQQEQQQLLLLLLLQQYLPVSEETVQMENGTYCLHYARLIYSSISVLVADKTTCNCTVGHEVPQLKHTLWQYQQA